MKNKDTRLNQLRYLLHELIRTLNGEFTSEDYHLYKNEEGFNEIDDKSIKRAEYTRDVLRQYIDSWLESDSTYQKWRKKNPELFDNINHNLSTTRLKLTDQNIDGQLLPNVRVLTPSPLDPTYHVDQHTIWLFIQFIVSALRERLGKCSRCRRYFIRSVRQNGMYCSRKCATHMTALISTKARRQREHSMKLERSHKALVRIGQRSKLPKNWKELAAKKAGVTRQWLTRAINKGELLPPKTSRTANRAESKRIGPAH